MNIIRFINLFFFILISSPGSNISTDAKGSSFCVTYKFFNRSEGNYDSTVMTEYIFIGKDVCVFKKPYCKTFKMDGTPKDSCFHYFVFEQNKQFGIAKESLTSKNFTFVNRDSFFATRTYKIVEFANKQSEKYYTKQMTKKTGSITTEKFFLKNYIDSSFCDTTLYYFDDNLKNVGFSIDANLDSLSKSKCYKKRALYYDKRKESPEYNTIYREVSLSFQRGTFFKKEELNMVNRLLSKQ